jgi:hypothetical protein
MGATKDVKLVKEYVRVYRTALKNTRAGRGHKGRARERAARDLGVSPQRVADVLVDARRLGLLDAPNKVPQYASRQKLRVTLADVFEGLRGTPYMQVAA